MQNAPAITSRSTFIFPKLISRRFPFVKTIKTPVSPTNKEIHRLIFIFSFKLNIMSVFVTLTLGAIFLISFTTILIAFTPLRELIPGYSSSKLKKDATVLALKSDSLSKALKKNEIYIKYRIKYYYYKQYYVYYLSR